MQMRYRLIVATTVLLVLLAAPPARADYAGQRLAGPRGSTAVSMALAFWHARNVPGCDGGVTAWTAPSLADRDGIVNPFGRGGGCEIWLSTEIEADLNAAVPYRPALGFACAIVFHEVGHALGLPHAPSGVMAVATSYPFECLQWQRQVVRQADSARSANRFFAHTRRMQATHARAFRSAARRVR